MFINSLSLPGIVRHPQLTRPLPPYPPSKMIKLVCVVGASSGGSDWKWFFFFFLCGEFIADGCWGCGENYGPSGRQRANEHLISPPWPRGGREGGSGGGENRISFTCDEEFPLLISSRGRRRFIVAARGRTVLQPEHEDIIAWAFAVLRRDD